MTKAEAHLIFSLLNSARSQMQDVWRTMENGTSKHLLEEACAAVDKVLGAASKELRGNV